MTALDHARRSLQLAHAEYNALVMAAGVHREAYRAGGALGPQEFYVALGAAGERVRLAERVVRKLGER